MINFKSQKTGDKNKGKGHPFFLFCPEKVWASHQNTQQASSLVYSQNHQLYTLFNPPSPQTHTQRPYGGRPRNHRWPGG